MSPATNTPGETVWTLPPLILHPFNERVPASALLENSRAALMLSGLIPSDGTDEEALKRRLLSGRYAELRMLFFLGDFFRQDVDQQENHDPHHRPDDPAGIVRFLAAPRTLSSPPLLFHFLVQLPLVTSRMSATPAC
jgi:hypothetical protein